MIYRSKMEASVKEQLLGMLDNLRIQDLDRFRRYLQNGPGGDFRTIKKSPLEKANRTATVDVMWMKKGQSEEKINSVLCL